MNFFSFFKSIGSRWGSLSRYLPSKARFQRRLTTWPKTTWKFLMKWLYTTLSDTNILLTTNSITIKISHKCNVIFHRQQGLTDWNSLVAVFQIESILMSQNFLIWRIKIRNLIDLSFVNSSHNFTNSSCSLTFHRFTNIKISQGHLFQFWQKDSSKKSCTLPSLESTWRRRNSYSSSREIMPSWLVSTSTNHTEKSQIAKFQSFTKNKEYFVPSKIWTLSWRGRSFAWLAVESKE